MRPLRIEQYNPAWAEEFKRIRRNLLDILNKIPIIAIEHVGSTANPGMVAKPILDIDVIVDPNISQKQWQLWREMDTLTIPNLTLIECLCDTTHTKTIRFMIPERSRTPFDNVEAESELVAGFFTEHGAIPFVLFFLAAGRPWTAKSEGQFTSSCHVPDSCGIIWS